MSLVSGELIDLKKQNSEIKWGTQFAQLCTQNQQGDQMDKTFELNSGRLEVRVEVNAR